jgi:uncharacterized protein
VSQFLIFGVMVLAVVGPLHYYIWRRMVRDTTRPGRWRGAGTIAVFALAGTLIAALGLPRVLGAKPTWLVALAGYVWLAVLFYLLVTLVLLEVPQFIARRTLRPSRSTRRTLRPSGAARRTLHPSTVTTVPAACATGSDAGLAAEPDSSLDSGGLAADSTDGGGPEAGEQPELTRRLLIARSAAIFAGLTAAGVTGYGVRTALGPPQVKRLQIPLAKLPRSMDGYRIALVSDIHLGPLTGIEHTRRIVRTINGLDADLVAVVGDLVDGSVAELGGEAAPLADLRSRDGSYFVTGNHEYYSGVDEWLAEVQRLGLRALQNERLSIRGIDLAGVNDVTGESFGAGKGPDFARTLDDRDTAKPVILLAHQPVQAYEAARHGVDLQLSGHTHGGQMVPFNLIAALQQPVISGLGKVDGVKVYVTNGAGYWGPPVRVGAPPDVSLVELRST